MFLFLQIALALHLVVGATEDAKQEKSSFYNVSTICNDCQSGFCLYLFLCLFIFVFLLDFVFACF